MKPERDLRLPPKKTCADCAHIRRCSAFGFSWPERNECDFWPVRFRPPAAPPPEVMTFRKSRGTIP